MPEIVQHLGELLAQEVRECAGQHLFAGAVHVVKKNGCVTLPLTHTPAAVAHQIRIENIGADKEGIVRLQDLLPTAGGAPQNRARHQHAGGLAAEQAGADHAPPHGQQLFDGQIVLGQLQHALVARDNHVQQLARGFPRRFQLPFAAPHAFQHFLRFLESAIPAVEAAGVVPGSTAH